MLFRSISSWGALFLFAVASSSAAAAAVVVPQSADDHSRDGTASRETVAVAAVVNEPVASIAVHDATSRVLKQQVRTFRRVRSFKVSKLELFDSLTNKKITDLINGMVVNVTNTADRNFNIRASVSGDSGIVVHSMRFAHNDQSRYHKETSAPYFFCGHDGPSDKPRTCNELNTFGTHTVTATPYFARWGRVRIGTPMTVTFEFALIKGANSPVPAPTSTGGSPSASAPMGAAVAPTTSSPLGGAPVTAKPMSAPVMAKPTSAPIPAKPTSAPVTSKPTGAPVTAKPTSAPVTAKPTVSPTNAPTPCPSLAEYINSVTLSNRTLSMAGTTPEDKALQWLIVNDTLKLQPCPPVANRFRLRQRFALLSMWFQQTESKPWDERTNWLTDDECQWYGITCSNLNVGDNAASTMAVTEIAMPFNRFRGTIPPDVGLLSSLVAFELGGDFLAPEPLPATVSSWSNLTRFVFGANGANPMILPEAVGAWTNLQSLEGSYVEGTLPSAVVNWTKLKAIDLMSAAFVGPLPEMLGQWTDLEVFKVSESFSGTIPSSIGNWKKDTVISMDGGKISGSLPNSMSQLTALQELDFADCALNGTLPSWIGAWSNVTRLNLNRNGFSGTLPASMGALTVLTFLGVRQNAFTGTIPESLGSGNSPKSLYADFQSNNFNGTVSAALCAAKYILSLDPSVACSCCGK